MLSEVENETQRNDGTCLRPHSWSVADLGSHLLTLFGDLHRVPESLERLLPHGAVDRGGQHT